MAGFVLRDDPYEGPVWIDYMARQDDGSFASRTVEYPSASAAWDAIDEARKNPRAVVMFSKAAETS